MQEGESNSEEPVKKNASRIPPLAESFVKETNSKVVEEKLQISDEEAVKENTNVDEEATTQNDRHSLSEENNSVKDTEHETNANKNATNKSNAQENSQKSGTAKDSPVISENTELLAQTSKNINLHVKQNFGAINVGLEYTGDDVQPLEEDSEGEEDGSADSESESEDEENENGKDDEQIDDIRAAYGKSE